MANQAKVADSLSKALNENDISFYREKFVNLVVFSFFDDSFDIAVDENAEISALLSVDSAKEFSDIDETIAWLQDNL